MIPGAVTVGYLHSAGGLAPCFVESLIDVLLTDLTGAQRIFSHPHGKLAKQCSADGIADGRDSLARIVVDESEAEWLWMVDSDMGFAPDTLERLIEAADPTERPVVGGLCFAQKAAGKASFYGVRYRVQPTVYGFHEDSEQVGFYPIFDYKRDQLVQVAGTGAACLLIHRSALETVAARFGPGWFQHVRHPVGPTKFSEDLSFCFRLAACDIPLHIHTGIKTTHDKGGVYLDEALYDELRTPVPWTPPSAA